MTTRALQTAKRHVRSFRTGVVPPHDEITIHVQPAIGDGEQPIVMSGSNSYIRIRTYEGTRIVLGNDSDMPALYVVAVASRLAVKLAVTPWGQVAQLINAYARDNRVRKQVDTVIQDRLLRILGKTKL